jgi:hypothetical protein
MRTRCSRWFAAAALAAVVAGCGSPEDEQLLRFLGFQGAGSSGTDSSVSMIEGDLRDGIALKVDASFENQTLALDSSGGGTGGITIYRVEVDYGMTGYDPPSFSYPVSLYAPPASSKDATGGGTVVLSDIPIVPVSVKQWLIDNTPSEKDGVVEMTAKVDFLGHTDAGEDLTVGASLAVTLTDAGGDGGGGGGTTEPILTIAATLPTAVDSAPTVTGQFTVYRNGSTANALIVEYDVDVTSTDAATPGTDYTALSGSVEIPAGSSSATIKVIPIADTAVEGDEAVTVTLLDRAGYTLGNPRSDTVTISDN